VGPVKHGSVAQARLEPKMFSFLIEIGKTFEPDLPEEEVPA
jgi:hypothetical protein